MQILLPAPHSSHLHLSMNSHSTAHSPAVHGLINHTAQENVLAELITQGISIGLCGAANHEAATLGRVDLDIINNPSNPPCPLGSGETPEIQKGSLNKSKMDSTGAPLITPNVVGMGPPILPFSLRGFWYAMGLEGDFLQRGPQTPSRTSPDTPEIPREIPLTLSFTAVGSW